MRALRDSCGPMPEEVKGWNEYLVDLLTIHYDELRIAYETLASDLNRTTLSVYAGTPDGSACWHQQLAWGPWNWSRSHLDSREDRAVGWLGTGDAHLKGAEGANLLAHLDSKGVLGLVGTLALPHHGSSHDNDAAFLSGLQPRLAVSTAHQGHRENWHHPGKGTVDRLALLGIPLVRVGRDADSELRESIEIHDC